MTCNPVCNRPQPAFPMPFRGLHPRASLRLQRTPPEPPVQAARGRATPCYAAMRQGAAGGLGGADIAGGRREDTQRCLQWCAGGAGDTIPFEIPSMLPLLSSPLSFFFPCLTLENAIDRPTRGNRVATVLTQMVSNDIRADRTRAVR